MKATDLLKEHHQEVEELFERMSQAESDEISALRDELVATLVSHSAIEEELFYPRAGRRSAPPPIPTSYEEHALVDVMLQKLLSAEPGDETFHARLGVLKELVQHHVEQEEKRALPQVESAMGAERLEELGSRLAMRFGQVRESDVEALLARNVAKSMPAAGRRARAAEAAGAQGGGQASTREARTEARVDAARRAGAGRAEGAPHRRDRTEEDSGHAAREDRASRARAQGEPTGEDQPHRPQGRSREQRLRALTVTSAHQRTLPQISGARSGRRTAGLAPPSRSNSGSVPPAFGEAAFGAAVSAVIALQQGRVVVGDRVDPRRDGARCEGAARRRPEQRLGLDPRPRRHRGRARGRRPRGPAGPACGRGSARRRRSPRWSGA